MKDDKKFLHKKSLGQNFLNSPVVPNWMVEAADLIPTETVLEIGPGTGALTRELLKTGAKVIAIEADQRAVEILKETFAEDCSTGKLKLFHTDVRQLDLTSLDLVSHQFKVVANIPYYLTGFLFRTILESATQPNQLVFLVQKEVARRACCDLKRGEKESLLSISIKLFGTPEYVKTVSRGHFNPSPKVDSAIISVKDIHHLESAVGGADFVFTLLHAGFGQKRKQLLRNLKLMFVASLLEEKFEKLSIRLDIRAEDLSVDNWLNLAAELYPHFEQ